MQKSYFRNALIVVVSLVGVSFALRMALHALGHNYNASHEGYCLYAILNVGEGKPLYPGADYHPYHTYLLSPGHALVGGAAVWLLSGLSIYFKVVVVRVLSLAFLLGALYLFVRTFFERRRFPLLAGILALALGFFKFSDYATTGRNDMLFLLAEVGALAAFVRWIESARARWLVAFVVIGVGSVYVRQTGVVVFMTGWLWLIGQRRFRLATLVGLSYLGLAGGLLFLGQIWTEGGFLDHLIAANVRQTTYTFDLRTISASSQAFLASYLIFFALAIAGLFRDPGRPEVDRERCLRLALGLATLVAAILVFRPGGDFNYFFEAILFAFYFVTREIELWWRAPISRKWLFVYVAIFLQLTLIAGIVLAKTRSGFEVAALDFESAARQVSPMPGRYTFVAGRYGDSLMVHLRGKSYHGPDVTDYPSIVFFCRPRFDWIITDLRQAVAAGRIEKVVIAEPGCAQTGQRPETWNRELSEIFSGYRFERSPMPWLCEYLPGSKN